MDFTDGDFEAEVDENHLKPHNDINARKLKTRDTEMKQILVQ